MSTMGGGDNDDQNKIKRFPNRAARVGEAVGFRRRVPLPDSQNPEQAPSDETAFAEVAEDLRDEIEEEIISRPELGIKQEDVDNAKFAFLRVHVDNRITNLENILEQSIREKNLVRDRAKTIHYLAASLAYLELTQPPE
ncbi:hypothetical protein A3B35_00855 [Candidatus Kaiserbacteria bacterium RIFCSPLOWO2_01_FULL_54_24]|uniref:Uncharacterized protein n=1 Tax=Candidatus Kaiserbacteria bacterium RIFCSPLOWO2_01_FULL_54_24 TaxID=1798515 RepID=A0A1F6ETI8_9BACT|nr:MAG: hypothetical protein A3B35_00855 [Candidatus Kaiserbacteria bacterium RIFCSPLOWO2_01_FULL_54_24]